MTPAILLYAEDIESFRDLMTVEEFGTCILAASDFVNTGECSEDGLSPAAKGFLRILLAKIKRDREAYLKKAAAGSQGGRPRKNQKNHMVSEVSGALETVSVSVPVTVKETETETETETVVVPVTVTVPTETEVSDYCTTHNITIPIQKFLDYYGERGWKRKNGRPIDWKEAAQYWAAHEWGDDSGAGEYRNGVQGSRTGTPDYGYDNHII